MRRLIALLLMLFALLAVGCDTARSEPALTVAALSIGKADSILLTDGAHSVLIDAGEEDDGDKVLDALAEAGVRRLDLIIFTHFDKDHIGGAPELLAGIRADRVAMPAYEPDGKRYRALLEALDGAGLAAERLTADTSLAVGDMAIDIWTPQGRREERDHAQCLGRRARGSCSMAGTTLRATCSSCRTTAACTRPRPPCSTRRRRAVRSSRIQRKTRRRTSCSRSLPRGASRRCAPRTKRCASRSRAAAWRRSSCRTEAHAVRRSAPSVRHGRPLSENRWTCAGFFLILQADGR